MQAGEKGASVFMTGVIVAISSLVVAVVAPIIGYLVRMLIILIEPLIQHHNYIDSTCLHDIK